MNFRQILAMLALAASLSPLAIADAQEQFSPEQQEFFESRIRPVLIEHCYECHNSAGTAEGGLALDHRQAVLAGGDGGPVLRPADPSNSRLLAVLRHEVEGMEMPQGGPQLGAEVIADFARWIGDGAADPRDQPPTADELAVAASWQTKLQQRMRWWSFQPVQSPAPPQGDESAWSAHPIDRFVGEKMRDAGLQPAEPAQPSILIRRLYFNLIGLPPSSGELSRWSVRMERAAGPERQRVIAELVDHLLQSPAFGQRWARHWMDWIRYAESHGSEGDPNNENAWVYRDYLIRALNADVPFDQLVREHIAGDLLAEPRTNHSLGINESAIGPAHWRMVFHGFAPTDALDEKVRFTDDQINAFSKAFLGLTVSCARCHDHKFDAISQRDYYALFGILGSCRPGRTVIDLPLRLNRHQEALRALKPRIRAAVAKQWLVVSAGLADDLAGRIADRSMSKADPPQGGGEPGSLLHLLSIAWDQAAEQTSLAAAWQRRAAAWQRRAAAFEQQRRLCSERLGGEAISRWDLADPDDYSQWFRSGLGLTDQVARAGDFAVATRGDTALQGVYPAGAYSHLLSTKHPARLTSADISLRRDSELWVQVIGDGSASLRYVVQNYPRSGTVYPVTQLASRWIWQRYDLAYWSGDAIHIELATAKDAPLLVKDEPRSWFGIRRAVLVGKGQPAVLDSAEHLLPIFQAAGAEAPRSIGELTTLYQSAVNSAVQAWEAGTASDAQALLLDACLREGLLPNTLASLPAAKPLLEEYRRLENAIPTATRVPGLDETVARDQPLLHRGDHHQPGDTVPRRFLEAIDPAPYDTPLSGRLELAEDLLRDDNPLTRRVIVNRLWHHLMGRGLVATPDNFGRLGAQPTHAELLDWLATRLTDADWSLKAMIRLIVTSQTWQLSSQPSELAQRLDPENRWLSHANVRRLEAEAIRDTLLAVSGQLDGRLDGAPVGGGSPRRSVYVAVARNSLDPFLRAFDFPEPFSTVGRRDVTNVPAQSLTMMNDPLISQYASAWAQGVLRDAALSDQQRVGEMFMAAFARPPSDAEAIRALDYLAQIRRARQQSRRRSVQLHAQLDERVGSEARLLHPIHSRHLLRSRQPAPRATSDVPEPIGRWQFGTGASDQIGAADGQLRGGAKLHDGALILNGKGHLITAPLQHNVREKTLEVWVQLDNLSQRGGGAMTIQTADGRHFDAIVFAEQSPQQWLAGSDHFARTRAFGGDPEREAVDGPVHLAVAWHADGRVAAYRNGKPYGQPYNSDGLYTFPAGDAVVGLGVRHLPAGGNRMLQGRIFQAQLYDRALSDQEIALSAASQPLALSDERLLAELSEADRAQVERLREEINRLRFELDQLGPRSALADGSAVWAELARALFTFQEFIYVR